MIKSVFVFICMGVTSIASAQIDLKKGLVLHLPFNGNSMDSSTYGNNAINYGATLTADQWGHPNSAYLFDGKSNYMRIPNDISLQCDTQISLCARVKVNGFYDGLCYANAIIDKGTPDFLVGNYTLRFQSSITTDCTGKDTLKHNFLNLQNSGGPAASVFGNTPYIKKGDWDCVIYTFDGTDAKMYVNGILRYTYAPGEKIGTNAQDVFLGRKNDVSYPYFFNGAMDEVRIYNRALNTLEIDSLCSQRDPQQTSAVDEAANPEVLPLVMNPVDNELILSLPANRMGGRLDIMTISGQKMISIAALRQNVISLDGISPGIYIVSYSLNGIQVNARVLKR